MANLLEGLIPNPMAAFKKRLVDVCRELQAIIAELSEVLEGNPEKEMTATTGKLAKVMEAQIKLAKILLRVLKALPS